MYISPIMKLVLSVRLVNPKNGRISMLAVKLIEKPMMMLAQASMNEPRLLCMLSQISDERIHVEVYSVAELIHSVPTKLVWAFTFEYSV